MARCGWLTRWRSWSKDKVMRWLLWIGLAGILLIALSEIFPRGEKEEQTASVTVSGAQVEQALEQRIAALLRQVEGVGACRVMVTLESGSRAVYAADTVSAAGADGSTSLSETYLTVDTDKGPVGLLLTHIQPTVKGVAVVCDGGGNPAVQQRVVQVVSTAFHISERRVCVVKQE
ncbi:MAG: hypothetical protein IKA50_03900 [Clostridia bacterium]|nr:hypothetical protein [Clostridia bacterium]